MATNCSSGDANYRLAAGQKILKIPGKKTGEIKTFLAVQKLIFGHFGNCKK